MKSDWIKEAEENARKYADIYKQNNQSILDQLLQTRNSNLDLINKQEKNALYNLNLEKGNINQTAIDNAKQANINRLLALKNNSDSMNRAGLATQGILGSQVNSINSSYGNNITSILNDKTSALRDLAKRKSDTNLAYDTNRINVNNDYGTNYADMLAQINNGALSQYNTSYNNYLNYKQQQYENERAEAEAAEKIRQYNENLLYQKERDKVSDKQWAKEYSLSKQKLYSGSGSYPYSDSSNLDYLGNNVQTQKMGNYYFKKADGSYTDQPSYINNVRLQTDGTTAEQIGVVMDGIGKKYRIWTDGNKYYVWDNNDKNYVDVTEDYRNKK